MAGDSQHMERSTLERKDRAELAAVAAALELKVPSRAKKADIVDLILEAVGRSDAPDPGDAGDAGPARSKPETTASASAQASLLDAQPAPTVAVDDATGAASGPAAGDTAGDGQPGEPLGSDTADVSSATNGDSAAAAAREATDGTTGAAGDEEAADEGSTDGSTDGSEDAAGEGTGRRRRRRRGRDRGDGSESTSPEVEVEPVEVQGLLDLREDGYGFLRVAGFVASREDVYVSVKQCRQLGLRKGDYLSGLARPATHKEKNPALVRIETVNGLDPDAARDRVRFDDLTAIDPGDQLSIGTGNPEDLTGELIDALAPVRLGARGLIVAPPNVDTSPVLTTVANAIEAAHPEVHVIVLLVDERPETVTSFRSALEGGEVVSSTFDRPADQHAAVAELAIEHAKRLVEYGNDVVVLLDSLTGLARAFNLAAAPGGRTIHGELDAGALGSAKRVFGTGRNVEDGGSLTVLATVLSDSGSNIDDVILTELLRGANSALHLEPATVAEPPRKLPVGAAPQAQKALLAELNG